MSIKLAIALRPLMEVEEENITLGTDPSCTVALPESSGAKPKHAVIRKIAGRWLIEVREAESFLIAGSEPKRLHWLQPGDVIQLTDNSPTITFQPLIDTPSKPKPVPKSSEQDVTLPPDSNSAIPATGSDRSPKLPPSSVKPTSSPTIRSVKIEEISSGSVTKAVTPKMNSAKQSDPALLRPETAEVPNQPGPLLKRLSSLDDDFGPDAPSGGLGMTNPSSEINWIMMVIGWSAVGGVILLVLWLAISFVWKTLSQKDYGVPQMPSSTTHHKAPEMPKMPIHPGVSSELNFAGESVLRRYFA
jgi:hypothetical protein